MRTGLVWHETTMWHDPGNHFGPPSPWLEPYPHPESVDSKRRIKNLLDASGLTKQIASIDLRPATESELCRVHDSTYVERVRRTAAAGGGNLAQRATTYIGANGFVVAALAAGGALAAVDALCRGEVENVYVLTRPPGHHAGRSEAIGFCVFNNAALAARHAQQVHGLHRVAILDWDAHHGNGAQDIFWEDASVLTLSIHQDRSPPLASGHVREVGGGSGTGFNINVPLPPGCGEGAYLSAFDRILKPALAAFAPELIIVACGYDAGFLDPTARMMLSSDSFRHLTTRVMDCAQAFCKGRLLFTHEGGYAAHTTPFHALATFETLSGQRTEVTDPFLPPEADYPHRELSAAQDAHIAVLCAELNQAKASGHGALAHTARSDR